METNLPSSPPVSKKMLWAGWIMTVLPALGLLFSAAMKFSGSAEVAKNFEHLGWPIGSATGLGILELSCTIIYLIPRTSVLGAILVTGYLGGAIATHVRIGEGFAAPLIMGVLIWGGVFLRDARLRSLIPLRRLPV